MQSRHRKSQTPSELQASDVAGRKTCTLRWLKTCIVLRGAPTAPVLSANSQTWGVHPSCSRHSLAAPLRPFLAEIPGDRFTFVAPHRIGDAHHLAEVQGAQDPAGDIFVSAARVGMRASTCSWQAAQYLAYTASPEVAGCAAATTRIPAKTSRHANAKDAIGLIVMCDMLLMTWRRCQSTGTNILGTRIHHLRIRHRSKRRGSQRLPIAEPARAQHPSETPDYLVTRVLAYCLEYAEGIGFSKGLSDPDEPAIYVRDLTGVLQVWVDRATRT